MSVEEMNQQRAEFDILKKELFDLKEKSVTVINSRGKEEEADAESLLPPGTITDLKRTEYLMSCDRTLIDFKSEIRSLYIHEQDFQRPRLQQILNSVYIPKLKTKSFAGYVYAGENSANHSNYKSMGETANKVFSDS